MNIEDKLDKLLELQLRALPAEEKCSICGELSTGKIAPVGGAWMGYCAEHKEALYSQLTALAKEKQESREAQWQWELEQTALRTKLADACERSSWWMRLFG